MTILIRKATRVDVPIIYSNICKLAEYLKFRDRVKLTEDDLYRDGFDNESKKRPYFVSLIAEDSDLAKRKQSPVVGHALFSYMYTWSGKGLYLNDFYVSEECRGKGVGKLLMKGVKDYAIETKSDRVHLFVVKGTPAEKFYARNNGVNATETDGYQFVYIDAEDKK